MKRKAIITINGGELPIVCEIEVPDDATYAETMTILRRVTAETNAVRGHLIGHRPGHGT